MRRLSTLAIFMLFAASPAYATEIAATSKITAVTVFPSGAQVTRTMNIKLEAGEHSILLNDVTGQATPASIRFKAANDEALQIMSVDTRRLDLPSTDPAVTKSERKQLEDQIEKLADERNVWKGVVKVAKEQRKYLRHLEKLPRTRTGGNTTGPREDWNAIYTLIGTRMTELSTTVREAKLKQRGINRQIKELKKKLKAIGGKSQNRTEMRVYVKAASPMETTLTLQYQVPSASWNAFYDAHLTTGDQTDGAARKLSLTRFASISQSSGEDWEGVALSLSTTKPGTATAAPDMAMLSVDFPGAPANGVSSSVSQSVNNGAWVLEKRSYFDEHNKKVRVKKVLLKGKSQSHRQIIASTFQAVHAISGRATIKSTG
ncbi:MAG: mucoidy inhibitor MuiA family protein, partial [Alphaproteobacteria bacterium]